RDDERAADPIPRLIRDCLSYGDLSRLAVTLDHGLEQTITLLLAAKSLRLIRVLDDALDPQWTAADDADSVLAGDRAELWAELVAAWLRESLDVTQVAAGASENERLTVLATPKKALFKGYGQSVPAMPMLRLSVLAVLADIGLGTARPARGLHAEVLRRHPLLQAHAFAKTEPVLHTCVNLGLATTPLQQPEHFGPSRFGLRLAAGLDRAMVEYARQDPSIAPLGIGLEAIEVPGDVIAAGTDGRGRGGEKVLRQW